MRDRPANSRNRRDGVNIPAIWVAFALSLLIHLAVLWQWLPNLLLRPPSPDEIKSGEGKGSLIVRLAPAPRPPPSPPQTLEPPAPRPEMRAPKAAARPRPAPPAIALNQPPPEMQSPPPIAPSANAPQPARPPSDGDLASYIEARRRARGQPDAPAPLLSNAQPVEDDKARSERIAAANLGAQRAQTFGYDPKQGGGVFQIVHMGYDNAEFAFFGWNKDIRRNTKQVIEVRKGNNSDIRIAVVRRMIAIIREYEREDFIWDSYRLGRSLTLSARERDNAGLEEFMMREFFDVPRASQ